MGLLLTFFMDRNLETKEFPALGNLPMCCHTTRSEPFFMLSLDLKLMERSQTLVESINSSSLYLSNTRQACFFRKLAITWANTAGKVHGIIHVTGFCCGRILLWATSHDGGEFPKQEFNAALTFLKSLRKGNFQLQL